MAKYIKLGSSAENFIDEELGIYLDKNNAAEVKDDLLTSRLRPFILTGYLVEIKKVQFDNIRLQVPNASNAPFGVTPLASEKYLNPAELVSNTPVVGAIPGQRFLVGTNPTGSWQGHKDKVATWNGSSWDFIIPENGYILPIYKAGVAFKYYGTYPSGYWEVPNASLISGEDAQGNNDEDSKQYALRLFQLELQQRIEADEELTRLINQVAAQRIPASRVDLADVNNYYQGNNVELVLQELALKLIQINQDFLTVEQGDARYMPISATPSISSEDIIDALGYIPYDQANPAGYITGAMVLDLQRGAWDSGYIRDPWADEPTPGYRINDLVDHDGKEWRSLYDDNIVEPGTDPDYWGLVLNDIDDDIAVTDRTWSSQKIVDTFYTKSQSDLRFAAIIHTHDLTDIVGLLDGGGKINSSLLPSYVDDVIEVEEYDDLPTPGESGKIYVVLTSGIDPVDLQPFPANQAFRWSGSTYVKITASPGTTDNVPEGSSNLYFSVAGVAKAYNKTEINNYFSGSVPIIGYNKTNWDTAYTNTHTHANKATLDAVNQGLSTTNSPTFAGLKVPYIESTSRISFYNGGAAQGVNMGSLLVSGNYSDAALVPTNGIYSQGNIVTAGTITATSFSGAGTGLTGTASGLSIGGNSATTTKLATARTINGVSFDGSANISIGTTVGQNLLNIPSGSTIRFTRINADNTISSLSDVDFRLAIGAGSVTSVALTVPTGLSVSGSPITSSGTLAISLASGYSIPTTAKQTQWDAAYGWGNHAGLYLPLTGGVLTGSLTATSFIGAGTGLTGTASGLSIGGNAGTATKLATARTINSVAFDGSSNISIGTAVGQNLLNIPIDTTIRFMRINADNTVSSLSAADFRTAIGADDNFMATSTAGKIDPNTVFTSSGYRFEPHTNNPTNTHYSIVTFGNGSNVTGQVGVQVGGTSLWYRGYNTSWGTWRQLWDTAQFSSTNVSNWNTAYGWGNHSGLYLPLTGGTITGSLTVTGTTTVSSFHSANRIGIYNGGVAQGVNMGSLLVSGSYTNPSLVPANGIYSQGNIVTAGTITATSFSGAGTGLTGTASGLSIGGSAAQWGGVAISASTYVSGTIASMLIYNSTNSRVEFGTQAHIRTFLGLGSNAYTSTAYLPLTGGTISGSLTVSGTTTVVSLHSANRISFLNGGAAQGVNMGSLLVSGNYSDAALVPTNGIYSVGNITTSANIQAVRAIFTGANTNPLAINSTAGSVYQSFAVGGTAVGYIGSGNAIFSGGSVDNIGITGSIGKGLQLGANNTAWMSMTTTGLVSFSNAVTLPTLNINGIAGSSREIIFRTAGSIRWDLFVDNNSELGSNAGSNFRLYRYSDSGASLGEAFSINRATGAMAVAGYLTAPTLGITGNASTGNLTVTGSLSTTSTITAAGSITTSGLIFATGNYGYGLVGLYDSTKYRNIYSMGSSYLMSADGTALGSHYGLVMAYQGLAQAISTLGHQVLMTAGGATQTAIGTGVWTRGGITALGNMISDGSVQAAGYVHTGSGLYNPGNNVYLLPHSSGYDILSPSTTASMKLRTGSGSGTIRGHVYADSSNNIGFLNQTGNWILQSYTAGVTIHGSLLVNSNISCNRIVSTSGGADSDLTLKNIVSSSINLGLSKVVKLFSYRWKNPEMGTELRYGYGAQIVQEVMPDAVYETNKGTLAVDYQQVHSVMLDEHYNRIEELEKRIKQLEEKLQCLG